MKIDEMPAGREMDCLIAEHVLNWGKDTPMNVSNNHGYYQSKKLLHYSTDIAAAWEVVMVMEKQGWSFRFSNNAWAKEQNAAVFFHAVKGIGHDILTGDYVYEDNAWAIGNTAPLAVCRAALKAVLQKEDL